MVHRARTLGFADFLAHPQTAASLRAAPYASYMRDATGQERATAYLRLEHLAEDIAPLVAHLGFRPEIGHENVSDRRADYRVYYDDETAARVASVCAADIERFGYGF